MRFLIAFLMVVFWPDLSVNGVGLALFLCAWRIYDLVDDKVGKIAEKLDELKRLMEGRP